MRLHWPETKLPALVALQRVVPCAQTTRRMRLLPLGEGAGQCGVGDGGQSQATAASLSPLTQPSCVRQAPQTLVSTCLFGFSPQLKTVQVTGSLVNPPAAHRWESFMVTMEMRTEGPGRAQAPQPPGFRGDMTRRSPFIHAYDPVMTLGPLIRAPRFPREAARAPVLRSGHARGR